MVSNIFHVSMLEMYSVPNYIHKLIHEITSTLYLYYESVSYRYMLEGIFQANSRHNIINVAFPVYLIFDRNDSLAQNGCINLLKGSKCKIKVIAVV